MQAQESDTPACGSSGVTQFLQNIFRFILGEKPHPAIVAGRFFDFANRVGSTEEILPNRKIEYLTHYGETIMDTPGAAQALLILLLIFSRWIGAISASGLPPITDLIQWA